MGIVIGVLNLREQNKKINALRSQLTNKGYKPGNLAVFQDHIVGIDTGIQKLCVANIKASHILEYNLSTLRDYELISNGVTVFKKSNVVGRAVVGGLLFGGVGAIVGATTSKSKGVTQTKSASLKLYTNNIDSPSITVKIFDQTIKQDAQKTSYLKVAENFVDKLAIVFH
jgi:hypothetical protein